MTIGNIHRIAVCTVAAAAIAASGMPAWAGEPPPETQARDLAAEVMRKAGDGGLGAWTQGTIDRALERAGEAARGADGGTGAAQPLPAERHAAQVGEGLAGRPNTPDLLVFMSLSVPPASWTRWAREAASVDAPLVLRGVGEGGLRATVKAVGARLGGADAGSLPRARSGSLPRTRSGVAIDPRLFRLFGVARVPSVVVVPGGVPPCASRGCTDDPAPPHDLVTGNIGLVAALEAVAAEGDAGRDVARRALERLEGER